MRSAAAQVDPLAAMQAAQADRKPLVTPQGESYSDEENDNIIDLELVPERSGDSAPTGLIRDRSIAAALEGQNKQAAKKSSLVKPEPTSPLPDDPQPLGDYVEVPMDEQEVLEAKQAVNLDEEIIHDYEEDISRDFVPSPEVSSRYVLFCRVALTAAHFGITVYIGR